MAENEISDYLETDNDNTDIAGISVQENVMRPPAVNNAFRAIQGALKRWFRSNLFRLRDGTDQTKLLAFDLSSIPTSTTRTLKLPASGQFVGTDVQSFSAAEQGQARANIGAGVLAGFRNKLINGDFSVWQRGVSITVPAGSSRYVSDRWLIQNETNADVIVSRYLISSSDRDNIGANPEFGLRLQYAVAPTAGNLYLSQRIEGVGTLAGDKASARYYVASSITGATARFNGTQRFGSGGSSAFSFNGSPAVVPGAAFAALGDLIDIPALTGKAIGDGSFLEFNLLIVPRATGSIYVAHCSLVSGDATKEVEPFSPRHIQQEEAMCQRYYEAAFGVIIPVTAAENSGAVAGRRSFIPFKVSKRATPSVLTTAVGDVSTKADNGFESGIYTNIVASNTGTTIYISDWSADAEL